MNPSTDKRKMPRMQIDLQACIFWGLSNKVSDVNIKNLSIHGLSFQSSRFFSQGTQFRLIFSDQDEELKRNKIQAEVVRCETLNSFSTDKFKVGAKFLFESQFFVSPKKNPSPGKNSKALQPLHSQRSFDLIHQGGIDPQAQPDSVKTAVQPACTIRIGEIKAEFLQFIQTSRNTQTIHTLLKIKESRFITTDHSSPSTMTSPEKFLEGISEKTFYNAPAHGKISAKQLPDPR